MIEQLLSTGGQQTYIGNSGPGPKALIAGDATLGYFGEVTDTQLFTPAQVAGQAGLYLGTDNPTAVSAANGNMWLKFIWNGKVIYIAKMPFRTNISWADLYAAGLVYGTRDNGKYPQSTAKFQYIQMPKYEGQKLWVLKPRLPTGYPADPTTGGIVLTGEWNQLFGRTVNDTNGGVGAPKFANFNYAATGMSPSSGPDSLVQETITSNINQCIVRGDGGGAQILTAARTILKTDKSSGTLAAHGWRPVLELIPDTVAKDPYSLLYNSVAPFSPIINDVRQWSLGAIRPANPGQRNWQYQLPQVTYSFANQALRPTAIRGTSESPTLKAFTISGSYVA